jgi:hypothetical protein
MATMPPAAEADVDVDELVEVIRGLVEQLDANAPIGRTLQLTAQLSAQVQLLYTTLSSARGTCEYDGRPLREQGRADGLYVCCSRGHCWRIGDAAGT